MLEWQLPGLVGTRLATSGIYRLRQVGQYFLQNSNQVMVNRGGVRPRQRQKDLPEWCDVVWVKDLWNTEREAFILQSRTPYSQIKIKP